MGNHAQVTVIGFGRMYEEGGCAGGGQRCCNLGTNMAAFANTCDNHPATASGQRVNRGCKRIGQTIAQCVDQALQATEFSMDRPGSTFGSLIFRGLRGFADGVGHAAG